MSYLNLFKLLGAVLVLVFLPLTAQASIDEAINNAVAPVANAVSSVIFFSVPVGGAQLPLIVLWLIIAATVFTVYFGFIQFRVTGQAIRLIRGVYDDPKHAGEVSHFQALATAVSGTVGLGNIAGVAVAVSIGGPGATFWLVSLARISTRSR